MILYGCVSGCCVSGCVSVRGAGDVRSCVSVECARCVTVSERVRCRVRWTDRDGRRAIVRVPRRECCEGLTYRESRTEGEAEA